MKRRPTQEGKIVCWPATMAQEPPWKREKRSARKEDVWIFFFSFLNAFVHVRPLIPDFSIGLKGMMMVRLERDKLITLLSSTILFLDGYFRNVQVFVETMDSTTR